MIDKRKIFSNLISLSFSEIVNKGIIFFTAMYLMRTIMPEGNGVLAFAGSYLSFFTMFVILAFNTVGTREIAKAPSLIKEYTDTIITTRFILSVIVFAVYALLLYSLNISAEKKLVTLITGLALFASAINLDWVFQGIEKMKVLALRQVLTSFFTLIGYLLLVHSRTDIYAASIIIAVSNLINVSWLFVYYIRTEQKFNFKINTVLLKSILKSAIPLSVFIFSVTVLNQASVMIMEYFKLSTDQIGIFNSAFKIVQFTIIPSTVVQMAFYPVLSRSTDITERKRIFSTYSNLNIVFGAWITLLIFLMPEIIIRITVGMQYSDAIPLLRMYIVAAFFMYVNTSLTPVLIAWSYEKKVMYSMLIGCIVSFIGNIWMISNYGVSGAVYASILGEFTIGIMLSISLYHAVKIHLFKQLFSTILITICTGSIGYILLHYGIHSIISGIITTLVFFGLALQFKIIKTTDLKGIIKR